MNRSNSQKALTFLGLVTFSLTFLGLGVWQWNRAQETRKPIVVSSVVVSLESVTKARIALPVAATLRHVRVSGRYLGELQAPHQIDGHGAEALWDVGLFQTESGAVILVVRGLWSERTLESPTPTYTVVGILMPHQSDNHAESGQGVLGRLDSSLIVGQTSADIYDGYLIAESERQNGVAVVRARVAPPAPRSAPPGFYWQHLSYVIIWWFMAGLVLYLPFYQRRVAPKRDQAVSQKEESHG